MTSPTPPPYPYQPLNPDPGSPEIRLLTLSYNELGDNTTPIPEYTLTLTHHPLLPSTSFTALSYVWGAPNPSHPLLINNNNHTIHIGPNLHSALARLQRQRWQGRIWIDALCINQADDAEKSAQVALMGRIYRLAEQVLVWLGPEPDVGGGLHAVGELGALFGQMVRKGDGSVDGGVVEGFVKTVLEYSVTAEGVGSRVVGGGDGGQKPLAGFNFEAIAQLFLGRPWWRRVWIIQEVVLARQAVMLCGADPEARGSSVSWGDVREAIRLFEWMILYPSTAPEHRRLYTIVAEVNSRVSHLALAADGYRENIAERGKSNESETGLPLLDTIIYTSVETSPAGGILATDPRDRIYGLLGLVRDKDRQKIPIDYSAGMSLNKVLFAVGKALLQQHGPDIISFCQRSAESLHLNDTLPSWVPDWTAPRMQAIGGIFFGTDGQTSKRGDASNGARWSDWVPKSRVEIVGFEDPVVSLPGVVVGRIHKVGGDFRAVPGSPSYLNDCRAWLLELRDMVAQGPAVGDGVIDEVWRVPMADFGLGSRADVEGASKFKHGFDVLTGMTPPPPELGSDEAKQNWISSESWPFRRVWKVYERRAFLDDAGRPGLAPKDTAVGDHIAVFAGGHVPFILRQRTSATQQQYRVLGPSYAQGLMDGEAVTDEVLFDDIELA